MNWNCCRKIQIEVETREKFFQLSFMFSYAITFHVSVTEAQLGVSPTCKRVECENFISKWEKQNKTKQYDSVGKLHWKLSVFIEVFEANVTAKIHNNNENFCSLKSWIVVKVITRYAFSLQIGL